MTSPKTKFPIESFGPELMQALLEGGRRRLVIKFEEGNRIGWRRAHKFRQRIHMLRQRMRQEGHPDYMLATRARASLFWGPRAVEEGAPAHWKEDHNGHLGAWLVIKPQDSEFADALAKSGIGAAGVEQPKPPATATRNPPPDSVSTSGSPERTIEDYDDLLDDLAGLKRER
jgi:hypothetical protein